MLIYRLSIWSDRGRIERDVEGDRHDALECIHAAGMIATGLQNGKRPVARTGRSPAINEQTASRIREAHGHLKEAWLLLSNAGAQEAVAQIRKGLRLSRLAHRRQAP